MKKCFPAQNYLISLPLRIQIALSFTFYFNILLQPVKKQSENILVAQQE